MRAKLTAGLAASREALKGICQAGTLRLAIAVSFIVAGLRVSFWALKGGSALIDTSHSL